MSGGRNTALALRYYQECPSDDGDPEKRLALQVFDEIMSPDFVMYFNGEDDSEAMRGRDEHTAFLIGHIRAFTAERWTVDAILADDRTVACQSRARATHTDTGNPIDMRAAAFRGAQRATCGPSSVLGL